MKTVYQFVGLERSEALQDFTQQKLDKIEKKYDQIISAEVHFKKHEGREPNEFECNMSLSIPGPTLFTESEAESFEAAVSQCARELERQLTKRKEQMRSY